MGMEQGEVKSRTWILDILRIYRKCASESMSGSLDQSQQEGDASQGRWIRKG